MCFDHKHTVMSYTFSNPFPLGSKAPEFNLPDTISGKNITLSELKASPATVIFFICNHCPYVVHIKDDLAAMAKEFADKGVAFIAISSNDSEVYPQDGPIPMKADALKHDYTFPYLFDETQMVAKSYRAACTPDFYVFNKELLCTYHGRFDGSSPKNDIPISGDDLRGAIEATLHNRPIPAEAQKPSAGCNIKWKAGVSPF